MAASGPQKKKPVEIVIYTEFKSELEFSIL